MSFQSTKVLYLSRCKYKYESRVVEHCHNFHHILYVVGGSGTLKANETSYKMSKYDMYAIPPGTNHGFSSDESDPLCTIEVKVLVGDPMLESCLKTLSLKTEAPHAKIKLILEGMLDEALHCRPQYKEIITANFIEFILNIRRLYSDVSPAETQADPNVPAHPLEREPSAKLFPSQADEGEDLAGRAIRYIHTNYDRKIVLKELARKLTVSSAHLCRVFCERYQMSPMQYLNHWRIREAKELLKHTDLSITEISAKVGFQSVHYLSRRFAVRERMSPLQYRQMMKEIVELKVEEQFEIVDHKIVLHR
ncbi:AraC family transcriptional regulator [Paenibacillus ginsengarvi]|nr:AraC family transcriptional regulator [Paenibacillus ginsengarvi]